jgi:hypothetical protein
MLPLAGIALSDDPPEPPLHAASVKLRIRIKGRMGDFTMEPYFVCNQHFGCMSNRAFQK